jgi:hypothetical protein
MNRIRHGLTILFFSTLMTGAHSLKAQSISTIRDTVNNADGSRFNGKVTISWQGFTSASGATIAPNSTFVNVTNGYLSLTLVPTTNTSTGAGYTVLYESNDGTVRWTESWQVAPSWTALTLNQVRVAAPNSGGSGGSGGSISLPISESNVTGLVADLAARPTKSATFTRSRAAIIDSTGSIASVGGNGSDCVHVDGTSGTCGTGTSASISAGFVDNEIPTGAENGTNVIFSLSQVPTSRASLSLYRNGLMLRQGVDYTLSGNTVTFIRAATPQTGDLLSAFYRISGLPAPVNFADGEIPAGVVNGVNATFALTNAPVPAASLQLFKNGALLRSATDYTVNGNTITFAAAALPRSGDTLTAYYRY